MKGILVILDGVGDLPNKQLGDKTPLEAAEMPNLDFLATRGEMGYMYPVKPGFIPGSDEALVSMFGNDLISSTRGQLEARGTDLKLMRGDLAFRVNFATIDSLKEENIVDRRAGRTLTTSEAEVLAKALNKIKIPCKFEFEPTIQHRAVLVFKGGFSDNILGNDPHPVTGKIRLSKPKDDDENSQYTANVVNEFLEKAYGVLDKHPVNEARRKKGLLPANYLLVRTPGIEAPKLKFYKKWLSPSYMPLEIGFSRVCGMKVFTFDYPRLKSLDSYTNLWDGLKKACNFSIKILKKHHKNSDYAYIHIKETDLPGHDNKPFEKKNMLEYIDKTLFKFLRKFVPPKGIKVVVTGDHSTPCKLKAHSADPVPVLLYNDTPPKPDRLRFIPFIKSSNSKDENSKEEKKGDKFSEKNARRGTLGRIMGKDLLEKVKFLR
ncbi:MAG TPA: 2,3-bisphosphoglycerate-independent phosphoglycerate mutase [Candidatus Pacearchaeota archaeon]|nr:2,3-bisphosphoglycerate-independent phosphoglycerate mutase [Candidatus Pacearchaeota archaeon]